MDTRLRALVLCAAGLVATCTDGGYRVVIEFEPAELADAVDRVEVSLPQECDPEGELGIPETESTVVIRRGEREGGLGSIAAGRVVLQGRGFDGDGCLVAVGCATVELEPGGSGDLRLTLGPSRGLVECSADGDGDADADGGEDGGDGAPEADADGDTAEGDAEAPEPRSRPVTLVATEVALTADRLCDLDGDGDLDNAIADLGSVSAELLLMAIGSFVSGLVSEGLRLLLHLPLVEDVDRLSDPSIVVLTFHGRDLDDPADDSDDFSGYEPFHASARSLDPCGEPAFAFTSGRLEAGVLAAEGGSTVFPISVVRFAPLRLGSLSGTVEPGGDAAEVRACGALLVREIGDLPSVTGDTETTLLEVLLGGGAAFGLPGLTGVNPDVDLDADGLERFVLDDSSHIAACVDGDGTVIEGRECWRDPRMGDGFGVATRSRYLSAVFAGRQPDWERRVTGTCEEPPEESLFDPR